MGRDDTHGVCDTRGHEARRSTIQSDSLSAILGTDSARYVF